MLILIKKLAQSLSVESF